MSGASQEKKAGLGAWNGGFVVSKYCHPSQIVGKCEVRFRIIAISILWVYWPGVSVLHNVLFGHGQFRQSAIMSCCNSVVLKVCEQKKNIRKERKKKKKKKKGKVRK